MTVKEMLRRAFALGPVLFGIGFIAPLVAQSLDAIAITRPLGLSSIQLGLAVGGVLGVVAMRRGRWV